MHSSESVPSSPRPGHSKRVGKPTHHQTLSLGSSELLMQETNAPVAAPGAPPFRKSFSRPPGMPGQFGPPDVRPNSIAEVLHPRSIEFGPLMPRKKRRQSIPFRPDSSISLWSIMKNCLTKEFYRIPLPVSLFLSNINYFLLLKT